jgi:Family of unknown function (DUF5681)
MAENTAPKQRGGFRPGQSGNPAGKPKGARNRTTLAVEALLQGEATAITRKAIERAKAGRLVLAHDVERSHRSHPRAKRRSAAYLVDAAAKAIELLS